MCVWGEGGEVGGGVVWSKGRGSDLPFIISLSGNVSNLQGKKYFTREKTQDFTTTI